MEEFAFRRRRLLDYFEDNSIVILPTASEVTRNRDVEYQYRPDSNFYYLTGFPEPEAVLVLIPEREHGEYILFCRERDETMETWHGRRYGIEGACSIFKADDAFPITDIDEILPGLLENKSRVYYTIGVQANFDQQLFKWLNQLRQKARAGVHAPTEFIALDELVHEMRLFKSDYEIDLMKKAAQISVAAHKRIMQYCQVGHYEYQLEAELLHTFMQAGSRYSAYPSIVGGGENACILHYTENSALLQDNTLVLVDAGAEYQCYAADITRTFPVNGRFTQEQKSIYNIVLKAQKAALAEVQPDKHWNHPHLAAIRVITEGLREIGILQGTLEVLLEQQAYKPFYMHRTGHWLGMDVHDVGEYKLGDAWRVLEPGMCLTIEPGIYIAGGNEKVDPKWWNIGIRIEDDVLVTETGYEILSAGVPKEIDEIEALMQN